MSVDLGKNPSSEVWLTNLEKSEGGTDETMFQFSSMSVWAADRAPATGTGEMQPFIWVDIHGQREDGADETMTIRLDRQSAVRMRDAIAEVLTGA